MNKGRHTAQLTAFVIIHNDKGEILLIRRANTGWRDGEYTFPAGHVDEGETALSACVHEVREEVDLEISENDLILKNVTQLKKSDNTDDHINFYFECKKYYGEAKIGEPDKSDDLIWISPEKFDEIPIINTVRFSFEKARKGEIFATWGFENEGKGGN